MTYRSCAQRMGGGIMNRMEKRYRDSMGIIATCLVGLAAVLILLLCVGCGPDNDGSGSIPNPASCQNTELNGVWKESQSGGLMTLRADCTGQVHWCGQNIYYTMPNANPGSSTVTVDSFSTIPTCLPQGQRLCGVQWTATGLGLNCGNGGLLFIKQ